MAPTVKTYNPAARKLLSWSALAALVVVFYAYVYQTLPFPEPWNDLVINSLIFLSAAAAAGLATLIWKQFEPGEAPRKVWGYLALGLWGWAIAEALWAAYAQVYPEMPAVTLADLFWIAAFLGFAASILYQFQAIYDLAPRTLAAWLFGSTLLVILTTTLAEYFLYSAGGSSQLNTYENWVLTFYPVADLAVALAAIRLSQVFGRGLLGRIWYSLLVFVFSDALYTWLNFTGIYAVSVEEGNLLSLTTDALYLVAYLLLALAGYAQLLLLKYGPPVAQPDPSPASPALPQA